MASKGTDLAIWSFEISWTDESSKEAGMSTPLISFSCWNDSSSLSNNFTAEPVPSLLLVCNFALISIKALRWGSITCFTSVKMTAVSVPCDPRRFILFSCSMLLPTLVRSVAVDLVKPFAWGSVWKIGNEVQLGRKKKKTKPKTLLMSMVAES